ncbi:MAG: phosphohistidine phosphatase SixA [bacterium]|nr:MAG: phosphohistidine phosphatase SixA [bacterium]
MHLFLVRHGEAVEAQADPGRPLSENGKAEASRIARFIGGQFQMYLGEMVHSPKTRAAQTARILADHLAFTGRVVEAPGLLPMDDPGIWMDRLPDLEVDTMLVGHLPHLSRLASTLLGWNSEADLVRFDTATVVCLEGGPGNWVLKWMVSPSALKGGP